MSTTPRPSPRSPPTSPRSVWRSRRSSPPVAGSTGSSPPACSVSRPIPTPRRFVGSGWTPATGRSVTCGAEPPTWGPVTWCRWPPSAPPCPTVGRSSVAASSVSTPRGCCARVWNSVSTMMTAASCCSTPRPTRGCPTPRCSARGPTSSSTSTSPATGRTAGVTSAWPATSPRGGVSTSPCPRWSRNASARHGPFPSRSSRGTAARDSPPPCSPGCGSPRVPHGSVSG